MIKEHCKRLMKKRKENTSTENGFTGSISTQNRTYQKKDEVNKFIKEHGGIINDFYYSKSIEVFNVTKVMTELNEMELDI